MSKFNFHKIENAFNNISLRERVYIFVALLICVCSISYFWIVEPAMLKQNKADKGLKSSYEQEGKINNEISEVKLLLKKDHMEELNNKIAFSLQTLSSLDKQLDDKLVKFISARKMASALANVLSHSSGVKVISLTSLPVSEFDLSLDKEKPVENIFYKHTLEVKLTGNYNAIYQYFLNLEAVQEKFYWSVLTYKVDAYPLAEVEIQIYTLSDQQDLVSG